MEGTLGATFDAIVADFLSNPLPDVTRRDVVLPGLPRKADAIVGMRRSGKTYFLLQTVKELEARGVPRSRCLYLSFEDERLLPLSVEDLDGIPAALYRRHPESRDHETWFLLDEVQNVPGWERFVRRLIDTERTRVIVTGSSAKLLSRELATSLRGRSLTTELLPFGFREVLRHAGIDPPRRWPPPSRDRSRLEHAFRGYLDAGGFPEVQRMDRETRRRVLADYLDVVLFRDVVERHEVTSPAVLRQLVRRLLRSAGSSFSVHRLFNDLKSQGLRVGKDTLHDYLGHLEDAYLVFTVMVDADSEQRRLVNPRKVYAIDPALAQAAGFVEREGRLLENLVYLELRRRGATIGYHASRSGTEVDFVVRRSDEPLELVQVCASLSDPDTKKRELRALADAFEERPGARATIVTLFERGEVSIDGVKVKVVPAWEWLLRES